MSAASPVSRRQSRSAEKRAQILKIAADYFLEHGFEGTSISEMARASGVSKESIYRYFRSKSELFEESIGTELADYQRRMAAIPTEKSASLRDQLTDIATALLGALTNPRTLALRRLVFQNAASQPEIGKRYYDIGPAQAYRRLNQVFRAHPTAADIPAKRLSRYFVAMVLQPVLLDLQCGRVETPSARMLGRTSRRVVDDFLAGYF